MKNCNNPKKEKCKCPAASFLCSLSKKVFGDKNTPIIACLNLHGVIGKDGKLSSGINIDNIAPLLKKAFETKNAKAVALNINSPGGSPVQSELIYNYIRELSEEKKIPVYTFAQDVAASGGYWLLLSGDEIYAHNSSIVGSIGVIFSSFGFVELIKKIGVSRRVYTEGKNKAILDPFLPEDDDNIKILKEAQNDVFQGFKEIVKLRRGEKLKESDENLFTGAFWSGRKALELGLVDGICDMRKKMKEKFGDKTKFTIITTKKGLIKSFLSEKLENNFESNIESALNKVEERIEFNKFGI
jgi:signal peptide peptidase SppA